MAFPAKEPALSPEKAAEVVARHRAGETVADLAKAFGVKRTAVEYQIKKADAKAQPKGEAAPDLSAVLEHPAIQDAISRAVAERLTEMMSEPAQPVAEPRGDGLDGLLAAFKHIVDVQAMQQPGYLRPLPADEIDRRLSGKVEMEALLRRYAAAGTPPEWRVGEKGFFECVNAIELHEGDEFATYLPPAEDFEPLNFEAEQVKAAMWKWLGTPTPDIGETVKAAEMAAKRPLIMPGALQPTEPKGPVRILRRAAEAEPRPTKRQFGTIVDEPRQLAGGGTSAPIGPAMEAA